MKEAPFYDPNLSYDENYERGPFGLFAVKYTSDLPKTQPSHFLGYAVNSPFGIPAGPLLNSRYIEAAFSYGFDLCVYKTVRSCFQKSHPLPNILAVHVKEPLIPHNNTVVVDSDYNSPLSITNSFGVPSFEPNIWQPDMARAVQAADRGQLLIGSFQGTKGRGNIEDDYALTAKLVAETGAPVLEANLSCPNEGTNQLLCFDIDKAERIAAAIKNAVPDRPLLIKLAYFMDNRALLALVNRLGVIVDGFSTVNTLPAYVVDRTGRPALGENRKECGICGEAIRQAALDMVSRLYSLRTQTGRHFAIVGVGGVSTVGHYQKFIAAGADVVMSATGAMWDPGLALRIKAAQALRI